MWNKFKTLLRNVEWITAMISGVSAIFMIVMIAIDVGMRNFFNDPIAGVFEITQYACMPLCVFPAMAFAYQQNVLPKFDGLSGHQNDTVRFITNIITGVVEIIIFAIMFRFSWTFAFNGMADKMTVTAGTGNLAIWPFYFFAPIGFTLLFIEVIVSHVDSFVEVIGHIKGKKTESSVEEK